MIRSCSATSNFVPENFQHKLVLITSSSTCSVWCQLKVIVIKLIFIEDLCLWAVVLYCALRMERNHLVNWETELTGLLSISSELNLSSVTVLRSVVSWSKGQGLYIQVDSRILCGILRTSYLSPSSFPVPISAGLTWQSHKYCALRQWSNAISTS